MSCASVTACCASSFVVSLFCNRVLHRLRVLHSTASLAHGNIDHDILPGICRLEHLNFRLQTSNVVLEHYNVPSHVAFELPFRAHKLENVRL